MVRGVKPVPITGYCIKRFLKTAKKLQRTKNKESQDRKRSVFKFDNKKLKRERERERERGGSQR